MLAVAQKEIGNSIDRLSGSLKLATAKTIGFGLNTATKSSVQHILSLEKLRRLEEWWVCASWYELMF